MSAADNDTPEELSARERARLRARDRKRRTRMVVDAAGLKATTLALARRRATPPAPADEGDERA